MSNGDNDRHVIAAVKKKMKNTEKNMFRISD